MTRPAPENPDAGQGPVLLDIGGDVGALVVTMPASTKGLEVEIRPRGAGAGGRGGSPGEHTHRTGHDHDHAHPGGHHGTGHQHVAVVARRFPGGVQHCLVYPALVAGDYELCPMPGDDVLLTATVVGGRVTQLVTDLC